jgi:hypothetical protein
MSEEKYEIKSIQIKSIATCCEYQCSVSALLVPIYVSSIEFVHAPLNHRPLFRLGNLYFSFGVGQVAVME